MHHFTTAKLQELLEKTIDLYEGSGAKSSAVLESMYAIDALRPCGVCGLPLDPQDQDNHMGHEDTCPHYGKEMAGDDGCTCEVYYHPDCCPECNDSRGLCEADGNWDWEEDHSGDDWEEDDEELERAYQLALEAGQVYP